METVDFVLGLILVCCYCLSNAEGNPVANTEINCRDGSHYQLGKVEEGFDGAVEEFTAVPGDNLKLVDHILSGHAQFLELRYVAENSTAAVYTKSPLDADAFKASLGILYYSIMCSNKIQNTRVLTINDMNDNRPVFDEPSYNATKVESLAVNSVIIQVRATDADATAVNNRITYSIVPPVPSVFEMTPNDGEILLVKRFNYNVDAGYNFTVEARDRDVNNVDRAQVTITLIDFDNMNPYFTQSLYRAVIRENETGEFLSILPEAILAKDGDTGINQPVVYTISTVFPSQYTDHFSIDPASGIITLVQALDREEVAMVTVNIQAAQDDDSLKTAQAVVSVTVEDVNDNEPEFDEASYRTDILENSPNGSIVLRAIVTDRDEGGFNGTLRIVPDSGPFSISPDGTLWVKDSTPLDREETPRFTFQIEAREGAAPNRVVLADVDITLLDVNDNTPQFESAKYEGKIFKNQTVGMNVTRVYAEDPDEGANGRVAYAIEGGNQEGYFSIDRDTGAITLEKEVVFEENKSLQFLLFVTATDGGQVPRSASTQVHILAPGTSNPQFLLPSYRGSLLEETDPPVNILKLTFLSPGIGVTLAVLDDVDTFSVAPDGTFSALRKLDREVQANYSVNVSISDGTNGDRTTVLIDVTDINDNDPVFAPGPVEVRVSEDAKLGVNVTEVAASDADDGFNAAIFYSLVGGEGKFSIDPKSAMISLAGKLDREGQARYTLEVVARDQGQPPRSATAIVVVNVTDVNDNSPRFPKAQYEVVVPENFRVGETFLELKATDSDLGSNALVTYRVVRQDPPTDPPAFIIDPQAGLLWLNQPLDFGKGAVYTLTVEALDGGTPALNGTCSVVVRVQDLNDKPPKFSKGHYDVAAFENLPSGSPIITLEVTDEDEAGFTEGHFILNSDTFSINEQGTVSLNKNATLDREQQDKYMLQVVAIDSPTDGLNATAQLNITVLDINDNNPQFLPFPNPSDIPEGNYSLQAPREVCRISATDPDLGDNGRVTLTLSNPSVPFQFSEDGTLLAVGPLDREEKGSYDLVITASDHGTPQRKNVTYITVPITDINDNDPEFSQNEYSRDILVKDAKEGDLILTLSAVDKDVGDNRLITYSFSAGSPLLSLHSETGEVTLTSAISEVAEDTMLKLIALARDHGEPQRTSTATVLVSLFTVTLVPGVAFENSSYSFSLRENEPEGTSVGEVTALTGSSLFQAKYSLRSHGDLFAVDREGVITTLRPLDTETLEWYNVEVEATDSRTPPNIAVTVVSVQVKDVNEAPVFTTQVYSAVVFTIAPYRYPIVEAKATDPDVGETGQLVYGLEGAGGLFEVEPSSGQVYVVSVEGEAGEKTLRVKATDPRGLSATAEVKVLIQESKTDDAVVLSLNQPINTVDEKISEVMRTLEQALGWRVKIIDITSLSSVAGEVRSSRETVKTYITFITLDVAGVIVPSEDVKSKLESERDTVKADLSLVFGQEVEHAVEAGPGETDSSQDNTAVIVLSVLLSLSIVALVAGSVTVGVKYRNKMNGSDAKDMISFTNSYLEDRQSLPDFINMEKEEPQSRKYSNSESLAL